MLVRAGLLVVLFAGSVPMGCRSVPDSGYSVHVTPEGPAAPVADGAGARTPPTSLRASEPDPAVGVHRIWSNLKWREDTLPDRRPFRWTEVYGLSQTTPAKIQKITLIVGPNDGHTISGVRPPLLEGEASIEGWDLEHCKGASGTSESLTLHRGFMCVRVESTADESRGSFPVWPLIIRTKSIPAGAYATSFVLLSIDKEGGSERDYVFRPNQAAFESEDDLCAESAAEERGLKSLVLAHPDMEQPQQTDETKCLAPDIFLPQKSWRTMSQVEAEFLKSACDFSRSAMAVIKKSPQGTPYDWRACGTLPAGKGRPPAVK